ncbi:hypothetical protein A0U42_04710 [Megasphaera sp. DISK 18]|nr:hypothetical protein A0U42_04710 [Megasphaera sp. DISK 18]
MPKCTMIIELCRFFLVLAKLKSPSFSIWEDILLLPENMVLLLILQAEMIIKLRLPMPIIYSVNPVRLLLSFLGGQDIKFLSMRKKILNFIRLKTITGLPHFLFEIRGAFFLYRQGRISL